MKTYTIDVACTNCGFIEFKKRISTGTPVTKVDCKHCGCDTLTLFPKQVFIDPAEKIAYATKMKEYAEVLYKNKKQKIEFLKNSGIYDKDGKLKPSYNILKNKQIGFDKYGQR